MRAVIQRVRKSSVLIGGKIKGKINRGLTILLGIEQSDTEKDVEWLTGKIAKMRIFPDENNHMNLDIFSLENPSVLVISQFTLYASTKKGNRPSFIRSAKPDFAIPLYESVVDQIKEKGIHVETGEFGAEMQVNIVNDGPVTIIIDSKNKE